MLQQSQQAQTVALPKRLPLVVSPQNRDATFTKDARLVNCYTEKHKAEGEIEYWIFKRPGLLASTQPSGGSANGYGVFNWQGDIYTIFGNTLYKNAVAVAGTVDTTGGVYRFDSCLGATPKLVLGNGVKAYTYDSSGGLVLINDADFPAAFRKGWAYLDGTMYVLKATAHIQGSGINDPTSWAADNDIMAQIEPDQGMGLAKQLVYVIAAKQWSTEVFYDNGNATGSPLLPVQGAKINYGCLTADSIQQIDGVLLWIATSKSSGVQVIAVDKLKPTIISTPAIERVLQSADYTTVFSWQLSLDGHRFYGITAKNSNWTLVYDLDQGEWSQWTDASGNYFPIVASTYNAFNQAILQHESNGRTYLCSQIYTNDANSIITSDIYCPLFDAGVESRGKYVKRMVFVGDKVTGSELLVRVNDEDYESGKWSAFRKVNLDVKRPYLDDMGTFNRRAHHFRHQSNTRMRLRAVELQMDLCTL